MDKRREQLIKIQAEYIAFLTEGLKDKAVFLHIHNVHDSQEDINKGIKFRKKIAELLAQIK